MAALGPCCGTWPSPSLLRPILALSQLPSGCHSPSPQPLPLSLLHILGYGQGTPWGPSWLHSTLGVGEENTCQDSPVPATSTWLCPRSRAERWGHEDLGLELLSRNLPSRNEVPCENWKAWGWREHTQQGESLGKESAGLEAGSAPRPAGTTAPQVTASRDQLLTSVKSGPNASPAADLADRGWAGISSPHPTSGSESEGPMWQGARTLLPGR